MSKIHPSSQKIMNEAVINFKNNNSFKENTVDFKKLKDIESEKAGLELRSLYENQN